MREEKTSFITNSMVAPCVGLALISDAEDIITQLQVSGKCQDWAAISLYLISYHPFLIDTIVGPLRWTMWLVSFFWLVQFGEYYGGYTPNVEIVLFCTTSCSLWLMVDQRLDFAELCRIQRKLQ